jgi:hypothetical protein
LESRDGSDRIQTRRAGGFSPSTKQREYRSKNSEVDGWLSNVMGSDSECATIIF